MLMLQIIDLRKVRRWEDMLLLLALAGPAGNLKNALLSSCLRCYVADCV